MIGVSLLLALIGQLAPSTYAPPVVDELVGPASPTPAVTHHFFLLEYDTNKDGVLKIEEMPDALKPRFQRADSDGNGVLDAREILAGNTRISREARRLEGIRKTRQGLERRLPAGKDHPVVFNVGVELLRRLDKNQDGWVDAAELASLPTYSGVVFGAIPSAPAAVAPPNFQNTAVAPMAPSLLTVQPVTVSEPPEMSFPPHSAEVKPTYLPHSDPIADVLHRSDTGELAEEYPDQAESVSSTRTEENPKKSSLPDVDSILKNLDLDANGHLDRREAVDQLADNFDRLDKDKDGTLSRQEITRGLALARLFGIKPKQDPRTYQTKP